MTLTLLLSARTDKDERVKDARDELLEDFDLSYFIGSSIGIAAGYLNLTAHLLGYKTGFCGGFKLNKIEKILNTKNSKLIIGIGYPDKTKDRREHHLDPSYIFPTFNLYS